MDNRHESAGHHRACCYRLRARRSTHESDRLLDRTTSFIKTSRLFVTPLTRHGQDHLGGRERAGRTPDTEEENAKGIVLVPVAPLRGARRGPLPPRKVARGGREPPWSNRPPERHGPHEIDRAEQVCAWRSAFSMRSGFCQYLDIVRRSLQLPLHSAHWRSRALRWLPSRPVYLRLLTTLLHRTSRQPWATSRLRPLRKHHCWCVEH